MAKRKNDESHAPRRKTVLAGHGTTRRNTKQRLQNIVSMLSLQQKKKWEVVHLGTKQFLQQEEDASQRAVLNHHCSIGCRSTGEETIFKQMSLLQAAKGNMPVQKGIEGYILLQGRGFQENFAKEIINRSPPMCTKSHTSGKLAHSVHDQRSVEYVGPILSSLSQLHGGFMQWTGHRELSRRAKLYQLEPRPFNDHMRTLLCQFAFWRPKLLNWFKMCCYCSSYYVPGRPNLCQFNSRPKLWLFKSSVVYLQEGVACLNPAFEMLPGSIVSRNKLKSNGWDTSVVERTLGKICKSIFSAAAVNLDNGSRLGRLKIKGYWPSEGPRLSLGSVGVLESLGAKNLKCKIRSEVTRDKTEVESEIERLRGKGSRQFNRPYIQKSERKASNGTVKSLRARSEKWVEGGICQRAAKPAIRESIEANIRRTREKRARDEAAGEDALQRSLMMRPRALRGGDEVQPSQSSSGTTLAPAEKKTTGMLEKFTVTAVLSSP
ncbi:hypothetical protein C8F04DRAFT_1202962 [Mycena alexandri]|uniref:Uncharacterized protein n=1 Tax=Mycena alexandri TaxID=1745969 RepID=A0AAD6WK27_9AGAR|nr:hypothetical protein C8F04DRAFT_1202962 [Mycena alexandri]